ncbi:MAG: acyltransferase [Clostridia bacterium]|nr:acyltransferase [Clostridia bacterium]
MKRNGKIEIFRFIFCIIVVLYHINLDMWNGKMSIGNHLSFFSHGRTCVEFFFLLSGFLMAKSIHHKPRPEGLSIGMDTVVYLYKKIRSVWIPYIILSVAMIVYIPFGFDKPIEYAVDRLPSLLFLQRTGIGDEGFISVSWYLSSLFFAIAVVYPFLRKFYDSVSLVAAPLVSSLAIGALIHKFGRLPQRNFGSFMHLSNIRALAVVLLGVFTYRVSVYLSEAKLSKNKWTALIITENLCWIVSLYYIVSLHSQKYEGHITYLMAVAIAISFARKYSNKLYDSRFVAYLGRISLPVYLSQSLVRTIVKGQMAHLDPWVKAGLIITLTLVLGIILDIITVSIQKRKTVS